MTFIPEPRPIPIAIGNLVVTLKDAVEIIGDDPQPAYQSGHFELIIEFDDGSTRRRRGDLVPHITEVQREALMDFMTTLRELAVDQILPN